MSVCVNVIAGVFRGRQQSPAGADCSSTSGRPLHSATLPTYLHASLRRRPRRRRPRSRARGEAGASAAPVAGVRVAVQRREVAAASVATDDAVVVRSGQRRAAAPRVVAGARAGAVDARRIFERSARARPRRAPAAKRQVRRS